MQEIFSLLAFWKFYRAYMDNKRPNLIWYAQIFVVASLINFVVFAVPERSKCLSLEVMLLICSSLEHYKWAKYH